MLPHSVPEGAGYLFAPDMRIAILINNPRYLVIFKVKMDSTSGISQNSSVTDCIL